MLSSGRFFLSRRVLLRRVCSSHFSTTGGGDDDDNKKDNNNNNDPFGINYDDGDDNLGSNLPPNYIRDKATGKFTGQITQELTREEEEIVVQMNDSEKGKLLGDRLHQLWNEDEDESLSDNVSEQIAEEETFLNTFGRSPSNQTARGLSDDGKDEEYHDDTGLTQPLTPDEFKSFQKYMKTQYDIDTTNEDEEDTDVIPTLNTTDTEEYHHHRDDNPDLDLAWMSSRARREMDGTHTEDNFDPYANLMPHDLNPTRLVNRRKAKSIPPSLLHHNNLSLLRRYITPTGQIMNRAQSRLGAKDQRKIAKLIKRARAIGLIPHVGQWKYENHGNKFASDIQEAKEWENELDQRGLSIK